MKTLTVKDLKEMVRDQFDDSPVKVWLPGTRISLTKGFVSAGGNVLLIEGNVDEGSALEDAAQLLDDIFDDKHHGGPNVLQRCISAIERRLDEPDDDNTREN